MLHQYEDAVFGTQSPQQPPLFQHKHKRRQQQPATDETIQQHVSSGDSMINGDGSMKEEKRKKSDSRHRSYRLKLTDYGYDYDDDDHNYDEFHHHHHHHHDDHNDDDYDDRDASGVDDGGILIVTHREKLSDDAAARIKLPRDDAAIAKKKKKALQLKKKKKSMRAKDEEEEDSKLEYTVDDVIPGIGVAISTTTTTTTAASQTDSAAAVGSGSGITIRRIDADAQLLRPRRVAASQESKRHSQQGRQETEERQRIEDEKKRQQQKTKAPLFDIYQRPPMTIWRRAVQWLERAVKVVLTALIALHMIDRLWLSWWIDRTTPEIDKIKLEEYSPEKVRQWHRRMKTKQNSGGIDNECDVLLSSTMSASQRQYSATAMGMVPLERQSVDQLRQSLQRAIDEEEFAHASKIAQRLAIITGQQMAETTA